MAETLTVNTEPDSATLVDNLTPDEQDSLQVGESMQAEQEQLLAGKYKNAEDLEKAYVELQKKLGEKGDETSETTGDTDAIDTEETSEETEKAKEDSPAVTLINEANEEFYANGNELSPETIEKFSSMSSQDLVNAYMEIQKNNPQPTASADLSDSDVNVIKNSVGGEAEYGKIVGWASENLDQNSIDAFDNIVEAGNKSAIQLALNGLRAQYENDNGYEGRMLTGKAPQNSGDVFRSQAEVVAAMNDTRYDNDPAYRQDLIEKLDRSNIDF
tara:strand:- start:67 stop:882 length:816 start_codon:yes stop_codon:yes gene_type:complete